MMTSYNSGNDNIDFVNSLASLHTNLINHCNAVTNIRITRMQEKALSEAMGSLRRVADKLTSTSTEAREPVREPQSRNNIKQVAVVAPRTPNTTNGGPSRTQCPGGVGAVFPAQDVRFKQGTLKVSAEATPAGDRL